MNKGVTLIEVLIAIAIVCILLALIFTRDNRTVVIDGCEYIQKNGYYSVSLTHKGNCTNRIHQYNN